MNVFLLIILIMMILGAVILHKKMFFGTSVVLLGISLFIFLSWFFVYNFYFSSNRTFEKYEVNSVKQEMYEIVSYDGSTSLYGDFLIVVDSLHNKYLFRFFDDEGELSVVQSPISKSTIIKTNKVSPRIVTSYYTKAVFKNDFLTKFFIGKSSFETIPIKKIKSIQIYVPYGTEFKLLQ